MNLFFAIAAILVVLTGLFFCVRREITWPTCLLLLSAFGLIEYKLESVTREEHNRDLELEISNRLSSITARLVSNINTNFSLIRGLAAHIATKPDITQPEFTLYAEAVFRQNPMLINLAAAPDMVIRMIYPIKDNEGALGLDYMATPDQRNAVLEAKRQRAIVVAGPLELVQGGTAIIGRIPVFIPDSETGEEKFWGIVSAPLDADALFDSVGLTDDGLNIDIAIRGRDGLGADGEVFWGNPDVFDDPRAVHSSIPVGDGQWALAAKPLMGWNQIPTSIWIMRSIAILLALGNLLILRGRHLQILNTRHYQKTIRENEQLLNDAGELAQIGGWKIHASGKLSHLSRQTTLILNLPDDQPIRSLEQILDKFDSPQANLLKYNLQEAITAGRKFDIELQMKASEDNRWLRLIGNPVAVNGHINKVVGAIQDITEKKKFSEMIQHQATHDIVTGLPNRFLFESYLSKSIAKAHREQRELAVLFLDLDKFKSINDNLGHKAGDMLLSEVGNRIKNCLRSSDTVARYSGDEFTLILDNPGHKNDVVAVAEKILNVINQPYNILNHQVFCSGSIGISIYPKDGTTPEDLISNADHAMYQVKKEGRNGWHYFTSEMQRQSERRHLLHNKLSSAIADKTLDVHYQPIMNLSTGKVVKCEALVRWFDNGTLVPTIDFISLAEETGMINEIDRLVLEQAGAFFRRLNAKLDHSISLSVNLSPRLFTARDNALALWMEIIQDLSNHLAITVEITERLLTQNSDQAMSVLSRLKEFGVEIAIDDFGTGYSSLSYLNNFPIDILKIDGSFVRKATSDESASTLTDTIISLAKKMSLLVVAEGIETEGQLHYLQQRNCDMGQGYLLGKPMDGELFAEWLKIEALKRKEMITGKTAPLTQKPYKSDPEPT